MIKKVFYLLILFLFTFFETVSAHVKWFVDTDSIVESKHGNTMFYYLTSEAVLWWAIIAAGVILVFSILDRFIKDPEFLTRFAAKHDRGIDRAVSVLIGLYLVSVSLVWNIILIPLIPVVDLGTFGLLIIQLTLGVMFVLGVGMRTAALGLLGLCAVMLYKTGLVEIGENLITISLALYLFIRHSPHTSLIKKLDRHAIEIVRIATGIALIVMAFSEKLMYPELALSFLDVHQWNFMYNMGLTWFTDELFVLSTGFAEMIFGIIFILGYLTRINTIILASFFAMSVVTMAVQFGLWEVEDLVVYAAAILFVFYGHGKTKFFHAVWPESILHTRTITNWFRKNI